ncbi:MAG: hypothetical protein Q9195_004201 [Heterodermia aff. obscurata]
MLDQLDFLSIDLSIDAIIIAQQLTLIAADLYHGLTLAECEVWQSLSPHTPSPTQTPHINAVINHSNELRIWVLRTLKLSTDKKEQAAQVASHIIDIADSCLALNNFSTLFSIVSALTDEHSQRPLMGLKAKVRSRLTYLQELISSKRGFWHYRQAIRTASLPCVPFLGFTLTDLSFIGAGTPQSKPDIKRLKTAEVWGSMQRFQSERYQFDTKPDVQILIRFWIELSHPEEIKRFV